MGGDKEKGAWLGPAKGNAPTLSRRQSGSTYGSLGSGAGGGECRRIRAECSSSSWRTASAAALLAISSAARAASTRSRCILVGGAKSQVTGWGNVTTAATFKLLF